MVRQMREVVLQGSVRQPRIENTLARFEVLDQKIMNCGKFGNGPIQVADPRHCPCYKNAVIQNGAIWIDPMSNTVLP